MNPANNESKNTKPSDPFERLPLSRRASEDIEINEATQDPPNARHSSKKSAWNEAVYASAQPTVTALRDVHPQATRAHTETQSLGTSHSLGTLSSLTDSLGSQDSLFVSSPLSAVREDTAEFTLGVSEATSEALRVAFCRSVHLESLPSDRFDWSVFDRDRPPVRPEREPSLFNGSESGRASAEPEPRMPTDEAQSSRADEDFESDSVRKPLSGEEV